MIKFIFDEKTGKYDKVHLDVMTFQDWVILEKNATNKRSVSTHISKDTRNALEAHCRSTGTNVSAFLREAILKKIASVEM